MTTVRKTAETTAILIVFAIGIVLLMRWCKTLSLDFFNTLDQLMMSRKQLGAYHSFLVTMSFWSMMVVLLFDAVYRNNSGLRVLESYIIPTLFTVCVAVWGLVATYAAVNTVWFWAFIYLGEIVCFRIVYSRLCRINGAGPYKIVPFLKSPPSSNDTSVHIVDRTMLYILKILVLLELLVLVISFIAFLIRYKQFFGL